MIDRAEFVAYGGDGGAGGLAFGHEGQKAKGGPQGGDGGLGGNLILKASRHVATLRWFAGKDEFEAEGGVRGGQWKMFGRNGKDLIIEVPVGTEVWVEPESAQLLTGRSLYGEDVDLGLFETKRVDKVPYGSFEERWNLYPETVVKNEQGYVKVGDLIDADQELVLCRGGRGGKGNLQFKSSTYTTPKVAQKGEKGEGFRVRLELKVLADVGLVGEPNVGKSTLLSVLTKAKPEIANYPFTTLSPNLGVLVVNSELSKVNSSHNSQLTTHNTQDLVLADIPGLIEDAHKGKGLGTEFLRHIERCGMLVYVIAPLDKYENLNSKFETILNEQTNKPDQIAAELWEQYEGVRGELEQYGKGLMDKPSVVVVNKAELIIDFRSQIIDKFQENKLEVIFVSAIRHEGLEELVKKVQELTR